MYNNRLNIIAISSLALIVLLAGCVGKATQTVQVNTGARETEVYQTVIAQFTQTAVAFTPPPALLPTITGVSVQPSATSVPPTSTTAPVEPTPTPQMTSTPRPVTTSVRTWQDDFEGEQNWFTGSKEDSYTFEYLNGTYRIYNNLLGSIVWSVRGDKFTDVRLEVDAMQHKGPKDGYYGLICRFVDTKNYYALFIGSEGTFGIAKMEKGKLGFIQQGDIPAKVLKAKDEYNRIRVDCIGPSLVLYVNDKKVIDAQDSSFVSGDVGIGAGNQLEAAGIDVVFDNFEIWQP
jgi:hypothetical protein